MTLLGKFTRRRSARLRSFAVMALLLSPGLAMAQMGPDYWKVTGVSSDDHLNIRSGAGASYRVVGMAPNGYVFRNLGCEGTGTSRWCHVETPDGGLSGWVAGRYLTESGAPGHHTSQANDVPELFIRSSGEMEVRFHTGCTALFNSSGRRIGTGGSCSGAQLTRANAAVESHMRESGGHGGTSGGGADVNLAGRGILHGGGGSIDGKVFGHKEGAYAVMISGGTHVITCTGLFQSAPMTVKSQSTRLHCTSGASGTAVLSTNRNGQGATLTFTLSDGEGGYILF